MTTRASADPVPGSAGIVDAVAEAAGPDAWSREQLVLMIRTGVSSAVWSTPCSTALWALSSLRPPSAFPRDGLRARATHPRDHRLCSTRRHTIPTVEGRGTTLRRGNPLSVRPDLVPKVLSAAGRQGTSGARDPQPPSSSELHSPGVTLARSEMSSRRGQRSL
jgi:hypothetical protein